MGLDDIVSSNDYQVIADSVQKPDNIRLKAKLGFADVNSCLIAHTLEYIQNSIKDGHIPTIAEMLNKAATIKEELSLSRDGFGAEIYRDIMIRELKAKTLMKGKKDKGMEVE